MTIPPHARPKTDLVFDPKTGGLKEVSAKSGLPPELEGRVWWDATKGRLVVPPELEGQLSSHLLDTGEQGLSTFDPVGAQQKVNALFETKEREEIREACKRAIDDLEGAAQFAIEQKMAPRVYNKLYNEAQKLRVCGSRAIAFECKTHDCDHVTGMLISCDSRFCPACQRRRTGRMINKYGAVIASFRKAMFLTLTQPDIAGESMRDSRDRLMTSFKKLRRTVFWDVHVKGGMYSWEATEARNDEETDDCYAVDIGRSSPDLSETSEGNRWHSHLHAIIDSKTGYIPLMGWGSSDKWVPITPGEKYESDDMACWLNGWKPNGETGVWKETEALFMERLQERMEESQAIAGKIRSIPGIIKRKNVKEETKRRKAKELHRLRMRYKNTYTLNEIWYNITRQVAEERGLPYKGGYICHINRIAKNTIKSASKELLKYATKPLAQSKQGLVETVMYLSETRRRIFQTFGHVMKLPKDKPHKYVCPSCDCVESLESRGSMDALAGGVTNLIIYSNTMTTPESRAEKVEHAIELATLLMRILAYKLPVYPDDPEKLEHGWGLQATRIKKAAENWTEEVKEKGLFYGYFGREDGKA